MTTTWKIETLEIKSNKDEYENVVITAHWRCIGEEDTHSTSIYGSCGINTPNVSFVDYSDLTEEQILEWCFEKIEKEKIENGVKAQIDSLKNPEVVNIPLPWNQ